MAISQDMVTSRQVMVIAHQDFLTDAVALTWLTRCILLRFFERLSVLVLCWVPHF
jgi:hypothetical protein